MARQKKLLEERYDLTKKVHAKVKMTRGKQIPRADKPSCEGMTFADLAKMSPKTSRKRAFSPRAICRCRTQPSRRRHGFPATSGKGFSND